MLSDGLDAIAGRVGAELLTRSHMLPPGSVAEALAEAARPLGVVRAMIYLADLQQRNLRPVPGPVRPDSGSLAIDSTVPGLVYRTLSPYQSPAGEGNGGYRVLLPLVDGTERLGVLELLVRAEAGEALLAHYRMLASLTSLLVVSKGGYSDIYARTRRTRQMALQGELVWAFLPPRTFATDRVLVTATTEPAYEVGGDAFDYSVIGDRLNVSIFDGAGHDLAAGLMASVCLASCRSTRRSGGSLTDVASRADRAIVSQFRDTGFVTALLCEVDTATGWFRWIVCGHPAPLLVRGNRVVKELSRQPQFPLGIAHLALLPEHGQGTGEAGEPPAYTVHSERLEPGDRILLYTDGVTEGHVPGGPTFGERQLSDFIIRHSDEGTAAPETLRRLNHAILDYQHGRLSDDATIVMVEWTAGQPSPGLTP